MLFISRQIRTIRKFTFHSQLDKPVIDRVEENQQPGSERRRSYELSEGMIQRGGYVRRCCNELSEGLVRHSYTILRLIAAPVSSLPTASCPSAFTSIHMVTFSGSSLGAATPEARAIAHSISGNVHALKRDLALSCGSIQRRQRGWLSNVNQLLAEEPQHQAVIDSQVLATSIRTVCLAGEFGPTARGLMSISALSP